MRSVLAGLLPVLWLTGPSLLAAPPAFTPEQVALYEKEVKPLLAQHCLKCHGGDSKKIRGGLDLSTRARMLAGGDTGPAVDLKEPAKSLFLEALNHTRDGYEMPPAGKLPAETIAVFTKWVNAGLPWTPGVADEAVQKEPAKGPDKSYWAYQPVKPQPIPDVKNIAWVRTPIDAFILSKLEAKNLRPVGPADRVALVRRAYYDLTGLPPSPEQVARFVNDPSPAAWSQLVDELLASPHYGEKWGRHWLDVVRYAETNGYERDGTKPFAWKYRDYVIRSFNTDKPYDRFLTEQLAGDELPNAVDEADPIIATGFYRLGLWDDEPADPEGALFDGYDDLVTVAGQAFLAMSLNCARCHDHKADFFPQSDYYRLLAFFRDIHPFSNTRDVRSKYNMTDITPKEKRKTYEAELKEREGQIERLTKQLVALEDAAIKKMPAEDQRASEGLDRPQVVQKVPKFLEAKERQEYLRLKRQVEGLKRRPVPSQEFALSINNCDVKPPQTHVLIRGNAGSPGQPVSPGFPSVFGVPDPTIATQARSSGRRTELARWLASPENPLTARVMINRVWQYHFGRGLVPTPNDFGKLGEQPTHPELLDWLAGEFVRGGWTLKRMHRLIMLSSTYQLASTAEPANLRADPANTLRWRFDMRRLGAEEVRDSMLAVTGKLDRTLFGPSIYPKIPDEVLAGISFTDKENHWPTSPAEKSNRRSVYVFVKRSLQLPILATHDQADTDSTCPVRYTTTVPTQALGMLNGEFVNEQAVLLAERLLKECPGDLTNQVALAIRLTTAREPRTDEVTRDVAFINSMKSKYKLDEKTAVTRYALLALNANEFVYLD